MPNPFFCSEIYSTILILLKAIIIVFLFDKPSKIFLKQDNCMKDDKLLPL